MACVFAAVFIVVIVPVFVVVLLFLVVVVMASLLHTSTTIKPSTACIVLYVLIVGNEAVPPESRCGWLLKISLAFMWLNLRLRGNTTKGSMLSKLLPR